MYVTHTNSAWTRVWKALRLIPPSAPLLAPPLPPRDSSQPLPSACLVSLLSPNSRSAAGLSSSNTLSRVLLLQGCPLWVQLTWPRGCAWPPALAGQSGPGVRRTGLLRGAWEWVPLEESVPQKETGEVGVQLGPGLPARETLQQQEKAGRVRLLGGRPHPLA